MVFAVYEVGVDACFVQCSVYGFLYEFFLCFLDGYGEFRVNDVLRNGLAINSHGVHGCNLHSHVAHHLCINAFEVEGHDGGELIAKVVVRGHGSAFEVFVSGDFGLFAGLAAFFNHEFGHGAAVDGESLELVDALDFIVEGEGEELLGQLDESGVLGYEVGLAIESDDSCEVVLDICEDAAFRSLTVFALGGDGLTF